MKILDQQLAGRDFMLGSLSVVDFAIVAYLITKLGRQLDYSATPNVSAWIERMTALQGFRVTES